VKRYAVVGVLMASVLAVACGDKTAPLGPTATVPQATTTTDPYAIPSVIDEAYVNRVLAGLDRSVRDVTRMVVQQRTLPPDAVEQLKDIYVDGQLLQLVVDTYQRDILTGLEGVRSEPGNRKTTVTQLITAKQSCLFAKVHTDASEVTVTPRAGVEQWIALIPVKPMASNPTRWGFVYEGFTPELTAPEDPCDAY